MEHIEVKSSSIWLADPASVKLYSIEFGITKARAELAISEKTQQEHKILNGTASFTSLEVAENQPAFIDIWKDDERAMEKAIKEYEKRLKDNANIRNTPKGFKAYQLFTRIEQAPNPLSRITLDTEKDSLGVPRSILHWEITSFEKRSIRKIYELIGQQVGLAGIGRLKLMDYLEDEKDESWPAYTGGGWHHMGTTRMSEDSKKGVVDANCKVHGIDNLYVAGSSCYATAGAPNPTLTLIALTLRLSDYLKNRIAGNIK